MCRWMPTSREAVEEVELDLVGERVERARVSVSIIKGKGGLRRDEDEL